MAAMSGAWLRRKVRHPWLGGPRRLTMYLATLDCATSNPSLSSSPSKADFRRSSGGSIRAAPCRSAVAAPLDATSNASSRESRPDANEKERLGPDDCENLQDCRKPAIQLDKELAIIVRNADATMQPASPDDQLMSKHRVLSFKP